jgi:hypothetical protein
LFVLSADLAVELSIAVFGSDPFAERNGIELFADSDDQLIACWRCSAGYRDSVGQPPLAEEPAKKKNLKKFSDLYAEVNSLFVPGSVEQVNCGSKQSFAAAGFDFDFAD